MAASRHIHLDIELTMRAGNLQWLRDSEAAERDDE